MKRRNGRRISEGGQKGMERERRRRGREDEK